MRGNQGRIVSLKNFKAWFWRRPDTVINTGPVNEFLDIPATSKTAATKLAKAEAKRRGWRFIELCEEDEGGQAVEAVRAGIKLELGEPQQ